MSEPRHPTIQIRLKDWDRLPFRLRQEILLYIPQVWLVWKPRLRWPKWLAKRWGRWTTNNIT